MPQDRSINASRVPRTGYRIHDSVPSVPVAPAPEDVAIGRRRVAVFTVASILAIVLSIAGGAQMAHAAEYNGGKWFNQNITTYNATTGAYATASNGARSHWNSVSDLNFTGDTSANANIRISTLVRTDSSGGVTEYTRNGLGFFVGQTKVYANSRNANSYSANCKRMVYSHELGHAVGLGHREGAYVMRSTIVECGTRFNPQSGDIASVNKLY